MTHQVRVIEGLRFDRIPFDELFAGNEPVLMRGLTADWPIVQAAHQGPSKVMELLAGSYNKKPVIVYVGDPEMRGRFGYNESATGFNYRSERRDFVEVLDRIRADLGSEVHSYYYMNSIVVDQSFPGLAADLAILLILRRWLDLFIEPAPKSLTSITRLSCSSSCRRVSIFSYAA